MCKSDAKLSLDRIYDGGRAGTRPEEIQDVPKNNCLDHVGPIMHDDSEYS